MTKRRAAAACGSVSLPKAPPFRATATRNRPLVVDRGTPDLESPVPVLPLLPRFPAQPAAIMG